MDRDVSGGRNRRAIIYDDGCRRLGKPDSNAEIGGDRFNFRLGLGVGVKQKARRVDLACS